MRAKLLGLSIALCCLLLSACQFSEPVETDTLVFADSAQPAFSLIYLADALGYFKEEQVNLILDTRYSSGLESLTATLQGKADIAGTFTLPVIHKAFEKAELSIFSTVYSSTKTIAVVALREQGIEQPHDLINKRIAVTLNTGGEFFLYLFLTSLEINVSQVRIFGVTPDKMAERLLAREVDAVVTWQPHIANVEAAFASSETISFYSPLYTNLATVAAKAEVLTQKKRAVLGFLKALTRAEQYLKQYRQEALQKVLPYIAKEGVTLEPSWHEAQFKTGITHVLLNSLEMQAVWMLNNGLKTGVIPDFVNYVDTNYLLTVNPEAVTLQ